MNNITLKQLRYFNILAQQSHFGRAAEICAVSQPALSMQIKELEETLNSKLVERVARKTQLTHFGKEFAERASAILRSVDELEEFTRSMSDQLSGQLRVGVIPTIAPYLLPKIINELANTFPALDIHIRETLTQNLIKEVSEGQLDTAIVALPISENSFTEVPLFTEEFVLVRPSADKGRPAPNRQMLKEMRLLLLEEGHCFRDQALSFCNIQTTRPREMLDGSSLSTLVQLVSAGIGVTLIPEMALDVETRSANVSVTRFLDPKPSRTIGMIWRKTNPLTERLTEISHIIRKIAE
ncbi:MULTISPECIES: hydrogen peroxide-inducible genes activator [unclassified Lentilitoribacter]|jgi:LysR family hydrogen peroxide-inducible transcriptional activator|uniref:hydrogen peroxide-inducible genes activator n=1 Tax=unclassified Lentilitoribacter TaxID=2647570 RepID=UPI0013A6B6E2|nr:hydrogen peroxide-inducible genes activator [Lentilitoribacter sp. Alg239-R112]